MRHFFDWLAKPMKDEDVTAWFLANNITPELTNLFRDFMISFIELMKQTYLGDDFEENTETKVGMTNEQKLGHFGQIHTAEEIGLTHGGLLNGQEMNHKPPHRQPIRR